MAGGDARAAADIDDGVVGAGVGEPSGEVGVALATDRETEGRQQAGDAGEPSLVAMVIGDGVDVHPPDLDS